MNTLVAVLAATFAATAIVLAPAAAAGPTNGSDIALSPMSEQQAVRKAKDYLDYTAFSRLGLIKQLVTAEDFSTADATYAVDSLTVDWNEQAAKKAKDYLEYTSFSHSGLITQLTTAEDFTPEQAAYGTAAVGL